MTRDELRQAYGYKCGYCGVAEDEVGAFLTVDHFRPRIRGGENEHSNLVYCCPACNGYKGDYWSEDDDKQLLHPQSDKLSEHVTIGVDSVCVPLTPRGANHIDQLRLNRPSLIERRRRKSGDDAAREAEAAARSLLERATFENNALKSELDAAQREIVRLKRSSRRHRRRT